MKISDCTHYPKNPAKPKADQCMEGDIETHEMGLRVCLSCGYVGCCEDDGAHAKKHAQSKGHHVIASYPADKDSFIWCYKDNDYLKT